jgi:hypothetical protein
MPFIFIRGRSALRALAPLRLHEAVEFLGRRLPAAGAGLLDDAVEIVRGAPGQLSGVLEGLESLLTLREEVLVARSRL